MAPAKKNGRKGTRVPASGNRATQRTPSQPEDRTATAVILPKLGTRVDAVPEHLVRGSADIVGQFFVALAICFNDLKDLASFEQPMLPVRPDTNDVSVEAGEWRGRHVFLIRMIAGVLHELMELISAREKLLTEKEFVACTKVLHPTIKADWDAVVDIALKKGGAGPMRATLAEIRNTASFHYQALPRVGDAWTSVFVNSPKTATNLSAVCALGTTLERTRFHFADAAVQAIMLRVGERKLGAPPSLHERIDSQAIEVAVSVKIDAAQVGFSRFAGLSRARG